MTTATRVENLIAQQRAEGKRLDRPPPAGDIRDPALLEEVLTVILTEHVEQLEANHPQQEMRWNGDTGQMVPYGRPQPPFDPGSDRTARALAILIGHLEDLQARK